MYKLLPPNIDGTQVGVIRLQDGACIPFDPANTDYQRYLRWLDGYELQGLEWVKTSDGNTPEPADPLPEAPVVNDPMEKLKAFLSANPDVASIINQS